MSQDSREQFEAWYLSTFGKCDMQSAWAMERWEAWQASRAAVVVVLPEPKPFEISAEESLEMDPDEYEALEARHGAQWRTYSKCKKAIEAAGVKVAP